METRNLVIVALGEELERRYGAIHAFPRWRKLLWLMLHPFKFGDMISIAGVIALLDRPRDDL